LSADDDDDKHDCEQSSNGEHLSHPRPEGQSIYRGISLLTLDQHPGLTPFLDDDDEAVSAVLTFA